MSVSTVATPVSYVGNNSAAVSYAIPWVFDDETWIRVQLTDADGVTTLLTLGADYAVTGAGNPAGGAMTTVAAYASTYTVTIYRVVPLTQNLDLEYNDRLPSALLEAGLDKLTLIDQQLASDAARAAWLVPFGETGATLPAAVVRAETYPHFDAAGDMETRTHAQVAADVATELNINGQVSDKVTVTCADAAARAALAPAFTGQLLVQLDEDDLYVGTGLAAGNWLLVASAVTVVPLGEISDEADLGQGAYTIYGGPVALKFGDLIYVGSLNTDTTKLQRVLSWDVINLTAGAKTVRTSTQDDDHNNAFIAIRPDQSQIVAVAVDHASGGSNDIHFFRSTGLAVSTLPGTDTFTHAGTAPTYAHPFINPADLDQLDTITRYGASAELDWRVLRSENLNGAPPTTTAYPLFINHYLKAAVASDGSGIWLAATNEPLGTTTGPAATKPVFSPRIALWFLDWATDEISSGGVVEGTLTTPFTQINGQSANELDYTNDYSNAAWTKERCTPATSTIANRWGATSVSIQKLSDNGVNNTHRITQPVTCDAGKTYEFSGYFRFGGVNAGDELYKILIYGPVGSMASHGVDTSDPQLKVNLADGTEISSSNNLEYTEITDVGNGWYRVGFVFTATDTVSDSAYVMLVNDADASVYAGATEGLYADSLQYGVTPYTTRLMPFVQNLTTTKRPTTAVPLVVYDPPGEKLCRLLAVKDVGEQVAFLIAEFDDHTGSKADDPARNARIFYREVNKTTWALSGIFVLSTSKMDGADDDGSTGSFTYLGGDIIDRMDVLFDQQNYDGSGNNRIVRAKALNGGTFSLATVVESSGTDQVMRPIAVQEVDFTGSDLRHVPSEWIVWMQGPYDGYTPARGDFDTDIKLAKLVS